LLVVTVRSELKNQPSAGRQIPGIKISRVCDPGKMPASLPVISIPSAKVRKGQCRVP
jgi:hypothetical protein